MKAYYINGESFGAECPLNWEDIADALNEIIDDRGIAEDYEAVNALWEDFCAGRLENVPMAVTDIDILMADRATRKEADALLSLGTTVYGAPKDWLDELRANDLYEGQTIEAAKRGEYEDITVITVEGRDYLIEYVH